MGKRSRRVDRMLEEIRRRGGIAGLSDDIPDDVAEMFLREVLDCPDSREDVERMARQTPRREH